MGAPRHEAIQLPGDTATAAYLAGVFDADGNVFLAEIKNAKGLRSASYCFGVQITNTDTEFIDWLMGFGGKCRTRDRRDGKSKVVHQWQIYGANAEAFLRMVLPYLHIKRARAEIALAYRDLGSGCPIPAAVSERRVALANQLAVANRRGI